MPISPIRRGKSFQSCNKHIRPAENSKSLSPWHGTTLLSEVSKVSIVLNLWKRHVILNEKVFSFVSYFYMRMFAIILFFYKSMYIFVSNFYMRMFSIVLYFYKTCKSLFQISTWGCFQLFYNSKRHLNLCFRFLHEDVLPRDPLQAVQKLLGERSLKIIRLFFRINWTCCNV